MLQRIESSITKINEVLQELKAMKTLLETESMADNKSLLNIDDPQLELARQDGLAMAKFQDFDQIKTMLDNPKWVEAADPVLICDPNSEADRIERGRGIIETLVDKNLAGLKFLDFGCGDGYCVLQASKRNAALAVGFDKSAGWDKMQSAENIKFTTSFEEVAENGPYDVVLMFDVLDHLTDESPIAVLKKVREIMKDDGTLYCRTHPFTSRHATHLYNTLNKAYLHLVFSPEELHSLLPDTPGETNIGVKTPIRTYAAFFEAAGLRELHPYELHQNPVPDFFKQSKIAGRIKTNLAMRDFPEFQLSIQFIDYVLGKST